MDVIALELDVIHCRPEQIIFQEGGVLWLGARQDGIALFSK